MKEFQFQKGIFSQKVIKKVQKTYGIKPKLHKRIKIRKKTELQIAKEEGRY